MAGVSNLPADRAADSVKLPQISFQILMKSLITPSEPMCAYVSLQIGPILGNLNIPNRLLQFGEVEKLFDTHVITTVPLCTYNLICRIATC